MITIKETSLQEAIKVNKQIPEFDIKDKEADYFEEHYKGKEYLILVAYYNNQAAGYMISYDKFNDGSIYCWLAAVIPKFRKNGILKALMEYLTNWSKNKGYNKVKIKTRNKCRSMLSFLVKNNFQFTNVIKQEEIKENRIQAEREI